MQTINNYMIRGIIPVLLAIFVLACSKDPGSGGTSTIYGKVLVRNFNSTFTDFREEYYAQDETVYIIYGNDRSYGDKIKTTYNGDFEFKYLRPGDYHLYCYSKDTTLQTNALIPVIRDVTITKNHQEVEVPLMVICK